MFLALSSSWLYNVLVRSPRISNFLWSLVVLCIFLWVLVGFPLFPSWIVTRWHGLFYRLGQVLMKGLLVPLGHTL